MHSADKIQILKAENKTLETHVSDLTKANDTLIKKQAILEAQLTDLLQQFKQMQRARFGSQSERYVDSINGQQGLFHDEVSDLSLKDDEDLDDDEPDPPPKKKKKKKAIADYNHLPMREEIIPVTNDEKTCACGCTKTVIGHEEKWTLNYIPAIVERVCQKREKVACPRCKDTISTAESPAHILPKSVCSPELLSHIVVSKCIDRQPLYHLSKQFELRHGVELSRQTLAKWVIEASKQMMPLVNLFFDEISAYHLSAIDATSIQVLREEGRKATTSSYMYCVRGGPIEKRVIAYAYNASSHKAFVSELFAGYCGDIHSDAQDIFTNLNNIEGINMSYCNAHARRKFEGIAKQSPSDGLAHHAMRVYKKLYDIERRAKRESLNDFERYALRQEKSKPIMDAFKQWLEQFKELTLPQSPLGKAIAYSLNHWTGLSRFLDNGGCEIDNNATERAIKPLVMARKNFLFSCSVEGADAIAVFFSLIQTAILHGWEPTAYLTALFKGIPLCRTFDDYEKLLPWNCQKTVALLPVKRVA